MQENGPLTWLGCVLFSKVFSPKISIISQMLYTLMESAFFWPTEGGGLVEQWLLVRITKWFVKVEVLRSNPEMGNA